LDDCHGYAAVINTCGFIGDAKEESINMILEALQARDAGLLTKVYVMGCLSERYRSELETEMPEVDGWYGKFDWHAIVRDLAKAFPATAPWDRVLTTPSHHAYLKIAEGCNRFCAFCAIPLITGRYKSRPEEEILEEVRQLTARGVKEFNIIAQDLSAYGSDLPGGGLRLASLIDKMAGIDGVRWIRLHYAYPTQFPYDILPVMAKHENVCKYLDIALQHIADPVLSNMRRHITSAETEELLARIRREVPGIHLRTTLMVGFPGEGEAEFDSLLDFVRRQRFERMGAFAYCEEDDTYAAKNFSDDIPQDVKQQRLDKLMKIQEEISMEVQQSKIGTIQRVVIDSENDDYYIGRTQFDSPEVDPEVLIEKTAEMRRGEFYDVEIIDALPFELIARPCQ
ncbi:MAG: 30S ribosomal protein S12 methylthiotransferase RimO, partial [Muribaculaceae bacterium]|nr:30S ribosomal protein S12 methylthiotransferase RimO [Muribaculaceae bacterium]